MSYSPLEEGPGEVSVPLMSVHRRHVYGACNRGDGELHGRQRMVRLNVYVLMVWPDNVEVRRDRPIPSWVQARPRVRAV